jgi:hypothetical protein
MRIGDDQELRGQRVSEKTSCGADPVARPLETRRDRRDKIEEKNENKT